MIWECTVCTNHFDGSSPPELCHSCGSPTEYFTAYHYYGLQTPSVSYVSTSRSPRPSYAETSLEATACFRFHAAKYFQCAPQDLYQNFLETRRTFLLRQRFAGRGFNSGFYFATTEDSAVAERLYYSEITEGENLSEPHAVLCKLSCLGREFIFLEVILSLQSVADLTDPIVLEYFLREGPARADFEPTGVPYALARVVLPPEAGGSRHTDGIGYHACSNAWNAVKFPSVRALSAAWGINDLAPEDILTRTAHDNPRASEESIEDQLRNQAIIVVFSGSLLTRSISQYAWIDASGTRTAATNPYFGLDSKTLEDVRIAFAKENRLTPEEAATRGYLSDEKILEEYTPNFGWIRRKESF